MATLLEVIKEEIEKEVRSGRWRGVKIDSGEGSLSDISIDDYEIDCDSSDPLNGHIVIVARGDGTIFSIENDEEQEQEHEVVVTAGVSITVEGSGDDAVYPVKISIDNVGVELKS